MKLRSLVTLLTLAMPAAPALANECPALLQHELPKLRSKETVDLCGQFQGKALVVVSSDLRELMLICDRIAVLSAGRLIDTFDRDRWSQDQLLAAAFAGYQKRDALLHDAAPRMDA